MLVSIHKSAAHQHGATEQLFRYDHSCNIGCLRGMHASACVDQRWLGSCYVLATAVATATLPIKIGSNKDHASPICH